MTTLADDDRPGGLTALATAHARRLSDRAKAERALGWKLAGPAFIVMLAGHRLPDPATRSVLSLFNYRLTDPSARSVRRAEQLRRHPDRPVWWTAVGVTVVITVVTVAVELVLGFGVRDGDAQDRHRPRRSLRTAILIPYGIITVVSAFAWQLRLRDRLRLRQPAGSLAARRRATLNWFGGTLVVAVRDLPVRDLEDHAVHLAAAARRAGPGARGPAGGGQGRRRHVRGSGCAR